MEISVKSDTNYYKSRGRLEENATVGNIRFVLSAFNGAMSRATGDWQHILQPQAELAIMSYTCSRNAPNTTFTVTIL